MSETFTFELVSPEKLLLSKPVTMVTVPGGLGEFGVLVGHSPMIATVASGVIRVYEKDDVTVSDRIFVAGGFAEVSQNLFTVLAQEAVPVADLNRAELSEQAKQIAEKLDKATEDDRAALVQQQEIVAAKLQYAA